MPLIGVGVGREAILARLDSISPSGCSALSSLAPLIWEPEIELKFFFVSFGVIELVCFDRCVKRLGRMGRGGAQLLGVLRDGVSWVLGNGCEAYRFPRGALCSS